ncbi:MAG: signal peptide peptidase SppA [Halioglobus sp.]
MSRPSLIRRLPGAVWNGITHVRVALSNILFLLVLLLIYFAFSADSPQPVPTRAALLLNPMGTIVDQKSYIDPLQAVLVESTPGQHEVLLRDVIAAVDIARDDPAITSLVMDFDQLLSVGISKSQEIAIAIDAFKTSGKPVVAVGDYFTQDQYFLASYADTVILHPFGGVAIEGFSSYRNYFRDALAKAAVTMHVFKAGEHKSMAEPFLRDSMSEGEKEITGRWLNQLWQQYTQTVESQRQLTAGSIDEYANTYGQKLTVAQGDTALVALNANLVDKLMQRGEAMDYIADVVGARSEEGSFEAVLFEDYVARKRATPEQTEPLAGDSVAVVTASGNILPGEQPAGSIGGDTLSELIQTAVNKEGVSALVLRVSTGGGSVFASEVIRREMISAKAQGLPVVVSMGSVAASGGYYIAANADQIWATPGTITGSIGVFAAFPTFEQLLERVGIQTDGVGTTELAGSLRLDRPLSPAIAESITASVQHTYRGFVELVAEGRGMSFEQVDTIAQGRVWSASDAVEVGLVDQLGNLEDAIQAAADLAGLEDYRVDYIELPKTQREQFIEQFADSVGSLNLLSHSTLSLGINRALAPVREAAELLLSLEDPGNLYLRCVDCSMVP